MVAQSQVLIIEDNIEKRNQLKVIFDFISEPCVVIPSRQANSSLIRSKHWLAILLGAHPDVKALSSIIDTLEETAEGTPIILVGDIQLTQNLEAQFKGRIAELMHYPMNYGSLLQLLHNCQIAQEFRQTKEGLYGRSMEDFSSLVGNSRPIKKVRRLIKQVSKTDANVLILGASGTGKEIVAQSIHEQSNRAKGPFIPINCGAIPKDLLESELFGHEKGAFTGAHATRKGRFEQADGGTIFLDEIGDMPQDMQVKLLRVLQERCIEKIGSSKSTPVDVRIIAATHRHLEAQIEQGAFREDLFYRLNVFPIRVPSLQMRVDDLPLLINELNRRIEQEGGLPVRVMDEAVEILKAYPWPGNVRELANLVERLSILYPKGVIDKQRLPKRFLREHQMMFDVASQEEAERLMTQTLQTVSGIDLKAHLVKTEIALIKQALEQTDWVVSKAARFLNMRRTTLVEKLKKYQLNKPM